MLIGFDQDLAAEATRTSNRIRGLLTHGRPRTSRNRVIAHSASLVSSRVFAAISGHLISIYSRAKAYQLIPAA